MNVYVVGLWMFQVSSANSVVWVLLCVVCCLIEQDDAGKCGGLGTHRLIW